MEVQVGAILEGKVTSITKFGAFVALEGGKSGLVHISEIAKVLSMQQGKIDLSIKKALPAPERPAQRTFSSNRPASPRPAAARPASAPRRAPVQAADTPSGDVAFEDKLKQFLSSSERKMADLNRNISGKQGGRRRR